MNRGPLSRCLLSVTTTTYVPRYLRGTQNNGYNQCKKQCTSKCKSSSRYVSNKSTSSCSPDCRESRALFDILQILASRFCQIITRSEAGMMSVTVMQIVWSRMLPVHKVLHSCQSDKVLFSSVSSPVELR